MALASRPILSASSSSLSGDIDFTLFLNSRVFLAAKFRLTLANLHFRMRLWRRVRHALDHFVAAARDFFVAQFLTW